MKIKATVQALCGPRGSVDQSARHERLHPHCDPTRTYARTRNLLGRLMTVALAYKKGEFEISEIIIIKILLLPLPIIIIKIIYYI